MDKYFKVIVNGEVSSDELDDAFGEDYKTGIYKDGAIIMTFELL